MVKKQSSSRPSASSRASNASRNAAVKHTLAKNSGDSRSRQIEDGQDDHDNAASGAATAKLKKEQQTLLNIFSSTFCTVLDDTATNRPENPSSEGEGICSNEQAFAAGAGKGSEAEPHEKPGEKKKSFQVLLQEVKQALYNRDFAAAFGRDEYLQVYAARWSPTRALCYSRVLQDIEAHLRNLADVPSSEAPAEEVEFKDTTAKTTLPGHLRALCIGGAAAEIVAFGDFLRASGEKKQGLLQTPEEGNTAEPSKATTNDNDNDNTTTTTNEHDPVTSPAPSPAPAILGTIHLLDTAPWGPVISQLERALTTAPTLSRYASAAARRDNRALLAPGDGRQWAPFTQVDVLGLSGPELGMLVDGLARCEGGERGEEGVVAVVGGEGGRRGSIRRHPILITLLFTLNELYTEGGIGRTTAFLRRLTAAVPEGSLLLVVDSPGSYSEAAVGGAKKKYPMQWLLDHTLLQDEDAARRRRKMRMNKEGPGNEEAATNEVGGGEKQEQGQETEKETEKMRWEKLESHDSIWFRLDEGLRYPIPLENMRYQMHLYRATTAEEP